MEQQIDTSNMRSFWKSNLWGPKVIDTNTELHTYLPLWIRMLIGKCYSPLALLDSCLTSSAPTPPTLPLLSLSVLLILSLLLSLSPSMLLSLILHLSLPPLFLPSFSVIAISWSSFLLNLTLSLLLLLLLLSCIMSMSKVSCTEYHWSNCMS